MIIDRLFSKNKNKNKFKKRDTINNKGEGEQVLRFITKSTGNFFCPLSHVTTSVTRAWNGCHGMKPAQQQRIGMCGPGSCAFALST